MRPVTQVVYAAQCWRAGGPHPHGCLHAHVALTSSLHVHECASKRLQSEPSRACACACAFRRGRVLSGTQLGRWGSAWRTDGWRLPDPDLLTCVTDMGRAECVRRVCQNGLVVEMLSSLQAAAGAHHYGPDCERV